MGDETQPVHFGAHEDRLIIYRGNEAVCSISDPAQAQALALALLLGQSSINGVQLTPRLRLQIAHAALGVAL